VSDQGFYTNITCVGNNVLVRYVENGQRKKAKVPYKPKLYIPAKQKGKVTKFRTLFNESLEEIQLGSIDDYREFKDSYKNVDNFRLFGEYKHDYAFLSEAYRDVIDWDPNLVVVAYVDIEVASDNGFPEPDDALSPVTAITLHVGGKFWVFGTGDFTTNRPDVVYHKVTDEGDLLRAFMTVWEINQPDVVSGWNSNLFDFPYLINRMKRIFTGSSHKDLYKKLSPWSWIKERSFTTGKKKQKETNFYEIAGVAMLDYIDLYKKFSGTPQESYKLGHIGYVECGMAKVNYDEYQSLDALYRNDHQKFIEYNIRDVEIVLKLEAKHRILEVAMTLAYNARVNYEDVFSQTRMWDALIYNHLKSKDIILPPKKDTHKTAQFEGAYVKDPKPGMYRWLASFDFTSLYPHLIMMFNLSPETLVEPVDYDDELDAWFDENRHMINVDNLLEKKIDTSIFKRLDLVLTPNGQVFRKDRKGFLPELMENMYKDRAAFKKQMSDAKRELETLTDMTKKGQVEQAITRYNNLQQTMKICLNSAFGVIGSQYFRFFDIRIAEAITLSAQLAVRWIQKHLNILINQATGQKGDYIIASDTDSVYVTFEAIVNKTRGNKSTLEIIRSLDKLCETVIGPQIKKFCADVSDYMNAFDGSKLDMKREALVDKAIWVKKKHYMLNVWNNEGLEYAKPKLKIVGMEAIKTSTPGICRKKIKEAFELIMERESEVELRQFVQGFRDEFMAAPLYDIAFPRGMNGLEDYDGGEAIYKSKTPIAVKGALIYNHFLEKLNLTKKYELLKDGEKVKFIYLREPNPLQSEVVSFGTNIPKEFGLDKYIDYNTMFEKTFSNQIEKVVQVIGWNLEEVSTLEGLFG
jgi:DNA polymerase elongation subunit (family B)